MYQQLLRPGWSCAYECITFLSVVDALPYKDLGEYIVGEIPFDSVFDSDDVAEKIFWQRNDVKRS